MRHVLKMLPFFPHQLSRFYDTDLLLATNNLKMIFLSFFLSFFLSLQPTPPSLSTSLLSNHHLLILREIILRHRQIQRRGALSRPARDVVVGAVTGAEPASEVAGFAYGDAAEVGADACSVD